jgi:hypothetical protein
MGGALIPAKVFLVYLRKPRRISDQREDPFWEFGSFGITLCHHRNLLSPNDSKKLVGARLAFIQPGPGCTKLVHVTPPVAVRRYRRRRRQEDVLETRWRPRTMPLSFDYAPTLIDRRGRSAFPLLKKMLRGIKGRTPLTKFASKFRTRSKPLPQDVSAEVLDKYRQARREAGSAGIAKNSVDAFHGKTGVTYDRRTRYRRLQRDAGMGGCTQRQRTGICASRSQIPPRISERS